MLQTAARTIRHAIDEPEVIEAVLTNAELRAFNSFWEYRIYMNPRLTLRDMWFPRSLAWKLREFWPRGFPARLPARLRRHRLQAAGVALPLRPLAGLAEVQEPGSTGGAARSGRGLGRLAHGANWLTQRPSPGSALISISE